MGEVDDFEEQQEAYEFFEASMAARRPLLDRFLLAIIDKNPAEKRAREQRLLEAKKALFGVSERGRDEIEDEQLLNIMMENFDREYRQFIPHDLTLGAHGAPLLRPLELGANGAPSLRQLAEEAAEIDPGHSFTSTVDRLRKKFASRYLKRDGDQYQLTDAAIETLLIARHAPVSDDAFEDHEVFAVLKSLGIAVSSARPAPENTEF
jgi:hypothetical protein